MCHSLVLFVLYAAKQYSGASYARRMFFDAKENDAVRAEYALEMIGKLYDIERKAKAEALDQAGVLELRQSEAIAILERFEIWMREQ